ncbi:RDD family protein [Sinimarinibacterium flocculans]|uniref:RDD family protein n=1 Tax=Sinimarinibacterium flocculans TaxID=985250 RepID=A0A318EG60_9GAMM|nr:RDD family protein [Sinimarinibacterium flocculans]PXV69706.1 RDD family protein [Sinimarinibacterium flocculans]
MPRSEPVAHPPTRSRITPEAFQVAPALLGLALAAPWRRLAAIAIDGLIVVVLAQSGGLMLGVGAAVLVYSWLRGAPGPSARRRGGTGIALFCAIVAFSLAVAYVGPWIDRFGDDDDASEAGSEISAGLSGRAAMQAGLATASLFRCDDEPCRSEALSELATTIADGDLGVAERRGLLRDLAAEAADSAPERERLRAMVDAHPSLRDAADDSVATPSPTAAPERPAAVAERPLLDESGGFSVVSTLKALADDLGFSFGWGAVYFTLLTVLWDGQTIGKRWLGIRVIALSGKPLSYWDAFDRYGGYAAGFATGLLGFLQVYWDDNRQAIHDRIAFTAVIRDTDGQALARARSGVASAGTDGN